MKVYDFMVIRTWRRRSCRRQTTDFDITRRVIRAVGLMQLMMSGYPTSPHPQFVAAHLSLTRCSDDADLRDQTGDRTGDGPAQAELPPANQLCQVLPAACRRRLRRRRQTDSASTTPEVTSLNCHPAC